ncbi:hypothetical protein MPER_11079, partial [Moniliophthora perniciosa FA553]
MNPANANMIDKIALSAQLCSEVQSAMDGCFNIDPASFYQNESNVLGQYSFLENLVPSNVEFNGQFYDFDNNIEGTMDGVAHSHGTSASSLIPTFPHNQQQPTTYLPHFSDTFPGPVEAAIPELPQLGSIQESSQSAGNDHHSQTSMFSALAENENTNQAVESFGCYSPDMYFDIPVPEDCSNYSALQVAPLNHYFTQGVIANESTLHGNESGLAGLTFPHYGPDMNLFTHVPVPTFTEGSSTIPRGTEAYQFATPISSPALSSASSSSSRPVRTQRRKPTNIRYKRTSQATSSEGSHTPVMYDSSDETGATDFCQWITGTQRSEPVICGERYRLDGLKMHMHKRQADTEQPFLCRWNGCKHLK